MSVSFTGSCSCGAIRIAASDAPTFFQGFCQCPDCRKAGSGHSAAISLLAKDVRITGECRTYVRTGLSGASVHQNFCPECGTSVFNAYPAAEGVVSINAALLDDPEVFQPEVVLFEHTALPWDFINPAIPRSAETPAASSEV